jgi:hypothetical protein
MQLLKKDRLFEDEFKARKFFIRVEKNQKSSYSYKSKLSKYPKLQYERKTRKNTEVLVKATSSCKNKTGLKAYLKYISRNGELEILTSDDEKIIGRENLNEAVKSFDRAVRIPTERDIAKYNLKEKREILNFVFSMKGNSGATTEQIQKATYNALKRKFPNNYFAMVQHKDTDNPHCHICLNMTDDNGKRINPRKKDFEDLRKLFAVELSKMNIEATATIKRKIIYDKEKVDFEESKKLHFKVLDFGEAYYNFEEPIYEKDKKEKSYFVTYEVSKGKKVTFWGKDLFRVITENNVEKGDFCRFTITDEEEKQVEFKRKVKDSKTGKFIKDENGKFKYELVQKTVYKKVWDTSILGKNEKLLTPLKKFHSNIYGVVVSDDSYVAPTLEEKNKSAAIFENEKEKQEAVKNEKSKNTGKEKSKDDDMQQ